MENRSHSADQPGMSLTGTLTALRHRNFRLFVTGQCFSLVGTWMHNMALSWLVLELTGSPFLLGLAGAFQFGPILLFSLFAGVVADQFPKRKLIIFTQSANMVLSLILGLITLLGMVEYWQVALLAFMLGTVNTLDVPARQSFLVELVGKRDLMNAIALNSSVFNGARILGPALAGIIIAGVNIAACFLINSASFLAVLAGLFLMRLEDSRASGTREKTDFKGEIKSGIVYILKTPGVLYPLALIGSMSALAMNFHVLVPVYARDVLYRDAQGFGVMLSAVGAGALAGALVLAYLSRFGPRPAFMYGAAAGLCIFQVALAVTESYVPALLILVLVGWSMATFTASVNSSIQLKVPHELRGRVMSIYFLLFAGMMPFGSMFSGAVVTRLGAQAGFLASGCAGLILIAVVWWRNKKHIRSTENVSRQNTEARPSCRK